MKRFERIGCELPVRRYCALSGCSSNQRSQWPGTGLCFGTPQDKVFLALQALLEPFGIQHFYSHDWGAYERHIKDQVHPIGKRNTQKIERKPLTLRTRIKRLTRKTICFSNVEKMHDIVIGFFINRYEFGRAL